MNGEMIASGVVTQIADDMKLCTYLYVVEQYRKMGFANRMITTARSLGPHRDWARIVSIDSVSHTQSM